MKKWNHFSLFFFYKTWIYFQNIFDFFFFKLKSMKENLFKEKDISSINIWKHFISLSHTQISYKRWWNIYVFLVKYFLVRNFLFRKIFFSSTVFIDMKIYQFIQNFFVQSLKKKYEKSKFEPKNKSVCESLSEINI